MLKSFLGAVLLSLVGFSLGAFADEAAVRRMFQDKLRGGGEAVWCSKDRVKAWNELMQQRIEPQAPTDCDNPIEKLIEYGIKLGANSTPTWFLESGERCSGAMPLELVRSLLDRASPPKR